MVRENCFLSFLFEVGRRDVGLCTSSNAIVVNARVTFYVFLLFDHVMPFCLLGISAGCSGTEDFCCRRVPAIHGRINESFSVTRVEHLS